MILKPGDAISEFGVMKPGDELMLFGRISGVKIGEVSAVISDIKWCEQPRLTKEYAICRNDGERFAEEGDSGAFVLNRGGQLVGILVGGNKAAGQAYVTPIKAVIDDISAQTGYDVCLP